MHGVILAELKKYVEAKVGPGSWSEVQARAGLGQKLYIALRSYPDEDAVALVSATAERTGATVPTVLEDFGEFLAPSLLRVYRALLRPEWTSLDLFEHVGALIHRVARLSAPEATRPAVVCTRPDRDRVVIEYTSDPRLCALAKGVVRGIARCFGETVLVSESQCMSTGSPSCRLSVQAVARSAGVEERGRSGADVGARREPVSVPARTGTTG